jgi:hypothetical protein
LTPQRRAPRDRAIAFAVAAAVCLLAAAPGATAALVRDDGGDGGSHGPGHRDRDGAAPRPVATRPAGRPAPPGAADALAVRGLRVPERVALRTAREEGIAASFVPRPGSLVADVRLFERSRAGRRLVGRRVVAVHGGRRTRVHLRAAELRPGAYEVAVRAGAGRATLGSAAIARIRVG